MTKKRHGVEPNLDVDINLIPIATQSPAFPAHTVTYDRFIKDKFLVLKELRFSASKQLFDSQLLRAYVVLFQKEYLDQLPKFINEYVSYGLYYRYLDFFEHSVGFLIVTISYPVPGGRDRYLDHAAKQLEQICRETVSLASGVELQLHPLEWKIYEKIIFKDQLTLSDFPISSEELEESATEHLFIDNPEILDLFTFNNKLSIIQRPQTSSPKLPNQLVLGTNFRDDQPVGINSRQLLVYGNNFGKNKVILNKIFQQLFVPGENTSQLSLVFNFSDHLLSLPRSEPYNIQSYAFTDLDLDPLQIIQLFPIKRSRIIKALIHILELLPTQIASFEGILTEYFKKMDKDTPPKSSITKLQKYIQGLLSNTISETLEEEKKDNKESQTNTNTQHQESLTEMFGLETMSTLGGSSSNTSDRTIETLLKKIVYLESLITQQADHQKISLQSLMQSNGIFLFQEPQADPDVKLLAFILLTELFNLISPEFQLIVNGFDYFLASIPTISQERYFWQYNYLGLRTTAIFTMFTNKPDFNRFFGQMGNSFNKLFTSEVLFFDFLDETKLFLKENTDLGVLQRMDYGKDFYLRVSTNSIEKKERNICPEGLEELKENLLLNEHLETVRAYELLEKVHHTPLLVSIVKWEQLTRTKQFSEDWQAIAELKKKYYIYKPRRLRKKVVLTPEARYFIESLPHHFENYQQTSIDDVNYFINNFDESIPKPAIESLVAGLIKKFLPELHWNLIDLSIQFKYDKISPEKLLKSILLLDEFLTKK